MKNRDRVKAFTINKEGDAKKTEETDSGLSNKDKPPLYQHLVVPLS